MDKLSEARAAIQSEIDTLTAEVERLNGVIVHLAGSTAPATKDEASMATEPTVAPKPRGRPKGYKAKKSLVDMDGVLDLIRQAGKPGIKALSLARAISQTGNPRPSKAEILESGKVKVSGIGGGTTYTYTG